MSKDDYFAAHFKIKHIVKWINSKKCSKIFNYIQLGAIVILAILNLSLFNSFQFKAEKISLAFNNWQVAQVISQDLQRVSQLVQFIDQNITEFKQLKESSQALFQKIKDSFIDDYRQQDQIPEIIDFTKKIDKIQNSYDKHYSYYQKILKDYRNFKQLRQGIRDKQYESQQTFRQSTQTIRNQLDQQLISLIPILKEIRIWYNEQKDKEHQKYKQTQIQQPDVDFQTLTQFVNLPVLAKQILEPQPIELVKMIYKQNRGGSVLQQRQKFYKQRQQYLSSFPNFPSLSLAKYNIQSIVSTKKWQKDITTDYQNLNMKYGLQKIKQQIGMCIIVPSYNNNRNFRVQLNLNSIFTQNYTNYKVVIVDDFSTDHTSDIIERYLKYYDINQSKAQLIVNDRSKKALENIYSASMNNCQGYPIAVLIDGDDQFIGLNVLKVINAMYTHQKIGVLYSNFYFYQHKKAYVKQGFTMQYSQQDKQQKYRNVDQKFSHLLTYKIQLLKQVKLKDLQQDGQFLPVAYDFAIFYPMMELACGHVRWIDEHQYLYNIGTGSNDYQIYEKEQKDIGNQILKSPPYGCSPKYAN